MFTTEDASKLFIEIILARVYKNFYHDMETTLLPEGLPGRTDDPIALQEWYKDLDEKHQKYIKEIVKKTIEEAIVRFLAILDNQIGYPVKGYISEFAVYLQTYQNLEAISQNFPNESVRINMSNFRGYDEDQLQGQFLHRLYEEGDFF